MFDIFPLDDSSGQLVPRPLLTRSGSGTLDTLATLFLLLPRRAGPGSLVTGTDVEFARGRFLPHDSSTTGLSRLSSPAHPGRIPLERFDVHLGGELGHEPGPLEFEVSMGGIQVVEDVTGFRRVRGTGREEVIVRLFGGLVPARTV